MELTKTVWVTLAMLAVFAVGVAAVNINVEVEQTTYDAMAANAAELGMTVEEYTGGILDTKHGSQDMLEARTRLMDNCNDIAMSYEVDRMNDASAAIDRFVPSVAAGL